MLPTSEWRLPPAAWFESMTCAFPARSWPDPRDTFRASGFVRQAGLLASGRPECDP